MKTTLLIVLLLTCPCLTAPAAASTSIPPDAPVEDGPLCWSVDLRAIPPVDVWFCAIGSEA